MILKKPSKQAIVHTIAIIGTLVILTSIWLIISRFTTNGHTAKIYSNNQLIKEIDLLLVNEPYEFVVENEYGKNTVYVENGAISVTEADCPDHVCVNTGKISSGLAPIICIPNRLEIRIERETELDGVAR